MADVVEFHERREDEERLHRRLEIQDYMLMKSSSVGVRVGTRQSRRGHGGWGREYVLVGDLRFRGGSRVG